MSASLSINNIKGVAELGKMLYHTHYKHYTAFPDFLQDKIIYFAL